MSEVLAQLKKKGGGGGNAFKYQVNWATMTGYGQGLICVDGETGDATVKQGTSFTADFEYMTLAKVGAGNNQTRITAKSRPLEFYGVYGDNDVRYITTINAGETRSLNTVIFPQVLLSEGSFRLYEGYVKLA